MSKKSAKKFVILRRNRGDRFQFVKYPESLALKNIIHLNKEGYEIYEEKQTVQNVVQSVVETKINETIVNDSEIILETDKKTENESIM